MKRAIIITAVLIVTLFVAGWIGGPRIVAVLIERDAAKNRRANRLPDDALHALASDANLTLFSIDSDQGRSAAPGAPALQQWPVLGQTTVTSAEQRRQLVDTLQNGLSRWSGREMVGCFNPRHAIRATDGTNRFEFLICFECGWLYYYPPDVKNRQLKIRIKAGPFDDLLIAANVPRPKQPQHQ